MSTAQSLLKTSVWLLSILKTNFAKMIIENRAESDWKCWTDVVCSRLPVNIYKIK